MLTGLAGTSEDLSASSTKQLRPWIDFLVEILNNAGDVPHGPQLRCDITNAVVEVECHRFRSPCDCLLGRLFALVVLVFSSHMPWFVRSRVIIEPWIGVAFDWHVHTPC